MIIKTPHHSGSVICASIFFLFVYFSMGAFATQVYAEEPPCEGEFCATEVCPELKSLKSSAATIGGNAWNTILGWIYHQWPADNLSSQFRVKKLKADSVSGQTGAEITGWSSYNRLACKAQREAGTPNNCPSICWGKTCGQKDSDEFGWNNESTNFCNDPKKCFVPPVASYYTPGTAEYDKNKVAYAELDYLHPEKVYEVEVVDSTTKAVTIMSGADVEKKKILKKNRTLKYCRYPVNGWLKIRQLKEDGWVKLSGRIDSTSVPIPTKGVDPGIDYVKWPKENCKANPEAEVCKYQVMYDPVQKEFVGWAWSPRVRWISFSGSTIYSTGSEWHNTFICGESCLKISFEQTDPDTDPKKGRSRWNSSFIGVWVQALGGNIFAKKGFTGVVPPPGEKNTPYLIVTGRYTEGGLSKIGAITSWESECDDPNNTVCAPVGRKRSDEGTATPVGERTGVLPDLSLPQASGLANRSFIKRSMLGTIDTSGFIPVSDALVRQINSKGNRVQRITDEVKLWEAAESSADGLANTIYYVEGDLVLGDADSDKKIIQNALTNPTGAGTVVVRGNLIIKRPFEYGSGIVKNIHQLASISWVVLKRTSPAVSLPDHKPADITVADWKAGGNISIDNCLPSNEIATLQKVNDGKQLARLVGTFFAENTIATGTGHGEADEAGVGKCANLGNPFTTTSRIYPERGDVCKGIKSEDLVTKIVSCTITQTQYYDVPLEIEGVLVAKNILFQRVYRGRNRGSEVIVNTGRALVNPSPGLAEFSKSLPSW